MNELSVCRSRLTCVGRMQHMNEQTRFYTPQGFQPGETPSTTKGASLIYHSMLQPDGQNKGFQKWSLHTQISLENWKNSFKILKQCTHDTKLRWLQFRILHNILTTNRSVAKFKPEQNPLCQFCKSHSETIYKHL